MENMTSLWASSGLAQIQLGQSVMMAGGLLLLFCSLINSIPGIQLIETLIMLPFSELAHYRL